MAAVLGCTIGKPLAVNGSFGGGSWYFSSWFGWGYGRSSGMSQNVIQDSRGSGGEDLQSMALGKISIRAGVSVTVDSATSAPRRRNRNAIPPRPVPIARNASRTAGLGKTPWNRTAASGKATHCARAGGVCSR